MSSNTIEVGPADAKRWYILTVFSMASAFQTNTWLTFSTVPDQVEEYYQLKEPQSGQVNGTIDLLLNWGPIMFIVAAPICAYILSYPISGLKMNCKTSVILLFLANFVRCIPCILDQLSFIPYHVSNHFWHTIIFLHLGQILNGINSAFVMSPPSKLSVIWFPENQRNTATAIAALSNVFGNCIAFLLGPLLVKYADDIPKLLYTDMALAFIPFVCILFYFPNAPSKVPSLAAKSALLSRPIQDQKANEKIAASNINEDPLIDDRDAIDDDIQKLSLSQHLKHFGHELWECATNYSTIITLLVGGTAEGMFQAWAGVLQDMMSPLGLDDTDIGIMGFNISFMSMVGGMIIGPIADKYFQKKLRKFIYILFGLTLVVLGIMLFILPSPWADKSMIDDKTSINNTNIILNVLIGFLGFFTGGLVPLFFELSAEVSYPVSEGSSGMLLVFVVNLTIIIFVGIGNWVNTKWETFFAISVCGLGTLFISTIKEQYKRK